MGDDLERWAQKRKEEGARVRPDEFLALLKDESKPAIWRRGLADYLGLILLKDPANTRDAVEIGLQPDEIAQLRTALQASAPPATQAAEPGQWSEWTAEAGGLRFRMKATKPVLAKVKYLALAFQGRNVSDRPVAVRSPAGEHATAFYFP